MRPDKVCNFVIVGYLREPISIGADANMFNRDEVGDGDLRHMQRRQDATLSKTNVSRSEQNNYILPAILLKFSHDDLIHHGGLEKKTIPLKSDGETSCLPDCPYLNATPSFSSSLSQSLVY